MAGFFDPQKLSENPEVSNRAFPSNPVAESNGSIETPLTGELMFKGDGWFQVRQDV